MLCHLLLSETVETLTIPEEMGGVLEVSGDRRGTLTLADHVDGPGFGLKGGEGRIFFADDPVAVSQLSFEGLEFYPKPSECQITPGGVDGAIGVALARVEWARLTDVRGNGAIAVTGTIGLPANLLGIRGGGP